MGTLTALSQNITADHEVVFGSRFTEVVAFFRRELSGLPFESTSLETIKFEQIANITVYVDYAVKGFDTMRIELLEVDVMNSDDEHLPKAEESLSNVLQEAICLLNESLEREMEYESSYYDYETH